MPCNAHNHPSWCECGWGGAYWGGGGGSSLTEGETLWLLAQTSWGSFVNPNARCPVCGDGVFFYQSGNGGRVFFDDLGPPWPKHPCTDRATWTWKEFKAPTAGDFVERGAGDRERSWQAEGWSPVAQAIENPGRRSLDMFLSLSGARICLADTGEAFDILWPSTAGLRWDGPVLIRRHPTVPGVIEIQTVDLKDHQLRIVKVLAAVVDDHTPTDAVWRALQAARG